MHRTTIERRLNDAHRRLQRARGELAVLDEQLEVVNEMADDTRLRALVAETPMAAKDHDEVARQASAMLRTRQALGDRPADALAQARAGRVKRLLVEQICQLAGGGCRYSGDPMREVNSGHRISESEFYGLVEILRESLRRHHVRLRERNELLALLAPMKRDVVNIPAQRATSADP